jgi:hypothetical protein
MEKALGTLNQGKEKEASRGGLFLDFIKIKKKSNSSLLSYLNKIQRV